MTTGTPHQGHRSRIVQKYRQFGSDALADHELLEILLFYSIPRVNTNDTAHALINEFGSLEKVFSASIDQLKLVPGIGENSATLISLVNDISKRFNEKRVSPLVHYKKLSLIGSFLLDYFKNLKIEKLFALFFDSSMRLISINCVSEGDAHSSSTSATTIARMAVLKDASAVVVAHNHLNGNVIPSTSDRNFTHVLEASLYALGVPLIEHIIVSNDIFAPSMLVHSGTTRYSLTTDILGKDFFDHFYSE